MAPNFLHLRASPAEAIAIVQAWCGGQEPLYEADHEVEENGWLTMSIDLTYQPIEEWLALGEHVDLLYETYSTSTLMGEIVYIAGRQLIKHVLIDTDNPDEQINIGALRFESKRPFRTWGDIWAFVDDWMWEKEVEPLVGAA